MRDYRLYLQDVVECCQNAADYTDGISFDEFSADRKTIDAVVRNLEIIGEAVKMFRWKFYKQNLKLTGNKLPAFEIL